MGLRFTEAPALPREDASALRSMLDAEPESEEYVTPDCPCAAHAFLACPVSRIVKPASLHRGERRSAT